MKGSFEEQATSLQTAVGGPWLTRNEARARQNLPQIEGGDELITPLNVLIGGQASPTDSPGKSDALTSVLAAFFARQGNAVKARLGDKAATWDADRWQRELLADLAAAAAPSTTYDPEGVL